MKTNFKRTPKSKSLEIIIKEIFDKQPEKFYMFHIYEKVVKKYNATCHKMIGHDTIRRLMGFMRSDGIINYECIFKPHSYYTKLH